MGTSVTYDDKCAVTKKGPGHLAHCAFPAKCLSCANLLAELRARIGQEIRGALRECAYGHAKGNSIPAGRPGSFFLGGHEPPAVSRRGSDARRKRPGRFHPDHHDPSARHSDSGGPAAAVPHRNELHDAHHRAGARDPHRAPALHRLDPRFRRGDRRSAPVGPGDAGRRSGKYRQGISKSAPRISRATPQDRSFIPCILRLRLL
jgi:hypothetical protein